MKRKLARSACLQVLAAGILLLAGCGGTSGAVSKTTTATPTRASYIVRANGVCRRLAKQIATSSTSASTIIVKIRENTRAGEQANTQLRALGLPDGSKVPSEFLHQRELANRAVQTLLAAKPGSAANVSANRTAHDATEAARRLAKSYGLRDCARV